MCFIFLVPFVHQCTRLGYFEAFVLLIETFVENLRAEVFKQEYVSLVKVKNKKLSTLTGDI